MDELGPKVRDFLNKNGWALATITPLAGDMSSRQYFRVSKDGETAVLMVADASMVRFVEMTNWLARTGASVPNVISAQAEDGLLLLEDLGNQSVKNALEKKHECTRVIFEDCVSLLLKIRAAEPIALSSPNAAELVEWTRLADAYYPGLKTDGLNEFRSVLSKLLDGVLETKTTSLRDFHTENMMWLPERTGLRRLGLLDYQDAILTHPAYDLVSLLTDARTWIPETLRSAVTAEYLKRSGDSEADFRLAFAALSAQRNLRILGIFARAGKHIEHMPNTYRYILEALRHPAFDGVRNEVHAALPAPEGMH